MSDDLWHIEEDYYSQDRKASRKERKRISNKDRSKFKKSDQDQLKKQSHLAPSPDISSLKKGRVLAIAPEGILVACDQCEYLCSLKGSLKQSKNKIKNLIAVGDCVRFEDKGEGQGWIVKVDQRYSILSRADNLSRNKEQLIAVNIDQVLIATSVMLPALKPFLIDRYIIATLKGNMQPIIIFNKIDLLTSAPAEIDFATVEAEKALYRECVQVYSSLGYKVICVSAVTGEGIEELRDAMRGKTSVFSGQSGVGKSSLINQVTGSDLTTGSIVQKTRKGSHTTTTAHLIPLEEGGFCIDTPGIKSFGLWNLNLSDIAAYYPEISALSSACKYPDCTHLNEPECAVKNAILDNKISPLRFASYCALMTSISETHRQR